MSNSNSGRLVWNHSTHIPGLIPVLERLIGYKGIQTITPAVIGRAKSHRPRLELKISVPIRGGFKIIARAGKTVQEVFILTELNQGELEEAIAQVLKRSKV
ncbi:MAG TPA: metal-binding protein [Cyanobacteria bacterium UBA12227]|nr:metal-binding protein [Cyanobacteria bacterium UBA12227]HAX86858.1 metal-binding protein [Cyanobacteria bacterium UBA11370]HBY81053.1 metal-binding protein [Cyanobacteria bacterium UBA11148]